MTKYYIPFASIVAVLLFIIVSMIGFIKFAAVPAAVVLSEPQFKASYFNNITLSGTPAVSRTESAINLTSVPSGVSNQEFSVRWDGTFMTNDKALYTFSVATDDGIRIWLDGKQVVNKWIRSNAAYTFNVTLNPGLHTLKVEYYQQWGGYKAKVSWNRKSVITEPSTPTTPTTPTKPSTPNTPSTPATREPAVVVFITGGGMTDAQTSSLQEAITAHYKARLGETTPWLILGYNVDVAATIRAQYPHRRVVLIGHSFGGDAAVKAASQLGSPIELLVLLDPVHIATPNKIENFVIPSNVKKAIAYRRKYVDTTPASGLIKNKRTQDKNYIYSMDVKRRKDSSYITEMHGWPVWQESVIAMIKAAVK